MLRPVAGDWAWDLVARLGLPGHLLGEVVPPGTVLGALRAEVAEETGLSRSIGHTPASHDTASAVAAVPFQQPGSAYISSGTWSLVGMEVPRPVIDERAFLANLTNEAGAGGTFQLMSNGTGLWLLQECRRTWETSRAGMAVRRASGHGRVVGVPGTAASTPTTLCSSPPVTCLDVSPIGAARAARAPRKALPPWCAAYWKAWPLAYRQTIELLTSTCGISPPAVHIVGGGSRNQLCAS